MNELMIQSIAHTVGSMKETMSSLEVAKLTGKEHGHVMRDIREMLSEISTAEGISKTGYTPTAKILMRKNEQNGKEYPFYELSKPETLCLAARYDAIIRMAIIMRWAELEAKEQSTTPLNKEHAALADFEYKVEKSVHVLDLLGYSQGFKRKEALEIGFQIQQDTGVKVIPAVLEEDPEARTPTLGLSPMEGTHAAIIAQGTNGATVTILGQHYGVTSLVINGILTSAGLQEQIFKAQYRTTAKERSMRLANTETRASGPAKGLEVISGWNYNQQRFLRDLLDKEVEAYKKDLEAKAESKKKRKYPAWHAINGGV